MHRNNQETNALTRRRNILLVVVLLALLSNTTAVTAEPLVTDRPDFTESAVTVSSGRLQIESGYTFKRVGEAEIHTAGELLFRIGLKNRLEARIGINAFTRSDSGARRSEGIEDSYLGIKIALAEGTSDCHFKPAIALIVGSSLPTGASVWTADEMQPDAKLCLAWELTQSSGLGANLNAASLMDGDSRYAQFSSSLSFATAISELLGAYVEYYGFVQEQEHGPNTNFVNGGITVLANDDLQFDARAGIGLNTDSPDYFVGIGISRRL